MPEVFKITCPECGEKFDPGSAIDNHIKNVSKQKEDKIRKESENKFKSQIEAKDKEIEKSKKDAEKKAQWIIKSLLKYDLEVKKIDLEDDKDIGSMSRSAFLEKLHQAEEIDSDMYFLIKQLKNL